MSFNNDEDECPALVPIDTVDGNDDISKEISGKPDSPGQRVPVTIVTGFLGI